MASRPLHELEAAAIDLRIDSSRDRLAPLDPELTPLSRVGPAPGPVIACCIFYKPDLTKVRRLIESLQGRVAGAVFIDGPYLGLSPEAESSQETIDTIRFAGQDFSVPTRVYKGRVWSSEPAKRTASARAALDFHHDLEDALDYGGNSQPWFLYIDSDEFLMSDIDWDVVGKYGYGSAILRNWDGDTPTGTGEGEGARMARLFPNSPGIVFGPAHYDLMDNELPQTYMGWDVGLVNNMQPAFALGHDQGKKLIETEYQAYNDGIRHMHEGRVLRTVQPSDGESLQVIRVDEDQQERAGWEVGAVAVFDLDRGYFQCVSVRPTEYEGVNELDFKPITEAEAAEWDAAKLVQDKAKWEADSEKAMRRLNRRVRHMKQRQSDAPDYERLPR